MSTETTTKKPKIDPAEQLRAVKAARVLIFKHYKQIIEKQIADLAPTDEVQTTREKVNAHLIALDAVIDTTAWFAENAEEVRNLARDIARRKMPAQELAQ